MASLTVEIVNGEAKVTADGTPLSCKVAHDVEKAMGQVTKSVPTAHRQDVALQTQKG